MKLCDNCEFRTLQDGMETCARCLEPFVARNENVVPGSLVAAAAKLKPKPKKKPKPIKKAEYKPAKKTTKGK